MTNFEKRIVDWLMEHGLDELADPAHREICRIGKQVSALKRRYRDGGDLGLTDVEGFEVLAGLSLALHGLQLMMIATEDRIMLEGLLADRVINRNEADRALEVIRRAQFFVRAHRHLGLIRYFAAALDEEHGDKCDEARALVLANPEKFPEECHPVALDRAERMPKPTPGRIV